MDGFMESRLYKFKNKISFRVFQRCIMGLNAGSFDQMRELVDFIGKYVEFGNCPCKTRIKNSIRNIDERDILNSDNYDLFITI